MSFGLMTVGRLTLAEPLQPASEQTNASSGVRTLSIKGQESLPPLTLTQLQQRHSDIVTLPNALVPVTFTDKSDRSGYYRVRDSGSELMNWQSEVATADWQLTLERIGTEHEIDFESRLSGAQTRSNNFSVTGERWHAPPIGHYAYTSGTTLPTSVSRTSSDGAITVYRGIPINTHPQWACPLANYLSGRARFIDANAMERSGVDFATTPAGWEMHNALVRVRPGTTGLEVSAWSSGAWRAKTWDVLVGGTSIGVIDSVTLLRNDPETVVLRVMWLLTTSGRVTADLTLRRGSRFVEMYIEGQTSATIKVQRATNEAGTATSGYVAATANDADGNRYIVGSAKTFTADTTIGGLSLASTIKLDLFIGAIVGGSAAVAGDQATNLYAQYIGVPSERIEGVRR